MQIPLRVSFHGIKGSDAMHDTIRKKAWQLDRYYEHIMSCRVMLELAGRHKRRGRQFVAHIDLKVPGGELAVTHQHDEDPQVALRNAFNAARRSLEDYARKQRGPAR